MRRLRRASGEETSSTNLTTPSRLRRERLSSSWALRMAATSCASAPPSPSPSPSPSPPSPPKEARDARCARPPSVFQGCAEPSPLSTYGASSAISSSAACGDGVEEFGFGLGLGFGFGFGLFGFGFGFGCAVHRLRLDDLEVEERQQQLAQLRRHRRVPHAQQLLHEEHLVARGVLEAEVVGVRLVRVRVRVRGRGRGRVRRCAPAVGASQGGASSAGATRPRATGCRPAAAAACAATSRGRAAAAPGQG